MGSKLTSFGFCDFEDPQGVWRALEFLHEKQLCDKKLLVKCEEKAKKTIEAWKVARKDELSKSRKEDKDGKKEDQAPASDEDVEKSLKKESETVAGDIAKILKDK